MRAFVEQGGLAHLVKGVLGGGIDMESMFESPAGKQAVLLSLEIINFYLLGTAAGQDNVTSESFLGESLSTTASAGAADPAAASGGSTAASDPGSKSLSDPSGRLHTYGCDVSPGDIVTRCMAIVSAAALAASASAARKEALRAAKEAQAGDGDDGDDGAGNINMATNTQKASKNAMKQKDDPDDAKDIGGADTPEMKTIEQMVQLMHATIDA